MAVIQRFGHSLMLLAAIPGPPNAYGAFEFFLKKSIGAEIFLIFCQNVGFWGHGFLISGQNVGFWVMDFCFLIKLLVLGLWIFDFW